MLWYSKRRASSYEIKEDKEERVLCNYVPLNLNQKYLKKEKKKVSDLTKTCRLVPN